jgi:hypothetical protein
LKSVLRDIPAIFKCLSSTRLIRKYLTKVTKENSPVLLLKLCLLVKKSIYILHFLEIKKYLLIF